MKKYLLILVWLITCYSSNAQNAKSNEALAKRISAIEDKMALKELVDTFSNLADQKDVAKQVFLFTENAVVASVSNGQPGAPLTGRKQIGDAFSGFLANFEVVYHTNGQQTVTLDGDKATGTSYCMVVLIGTEDGKKMKTSMGVYYHDEYVRENGKWLIAKRQSNFTWREKKELAQ